MPETGLDGNRSLTMHKYFHTTRYWTWECSTMLGVKLIHVVKGALWQYNIDPSVSGVILQSTCAPQSLGTVQCGHNPLSCEGGHIILQYQITVLCATTTKHSKAQVVYLIVVRGKTNKTYRFEYTDDWTKWLILRKRNMSSVCHKP